MTGGLMTNEDKITVKRKYFQPIPPDPEFEKMGKNTNKYKTRERSKMCIHCLNIATQWLCYDVDGATFRERMCDTCIKENKHLQQQNELLELVTRAEPGTTSYEQLHARNREE